MKGVRDRWARRLLCRWHAGLREHAPHRRVMQHELTRDRADRPVFGVVQTQHLGFHRATDHPCRSTEAPTPSWTQTRERR
jgi:hypothetical protein